MLRFPLPRGLRLAGRAGCPARPQLLQVSRSPVRDVPRTAGCELSRFQSTSVVEEAFAAPRPIVKGVEVKDGEVLLFEAGHASKKTLIQYWFTSSIMWAYLGISSSLAIALPAAEIRTPWSSVMTGAVTLAAAISSVLSASASRAHVRYAVLEADGHHVRLYTYGSLFGIGVGKPVQVPIKHLSIASNFKRKKFDTEAIHVYVKDGRAPLTFDKPDGLFDLNRVEGTGLLFGKAGLLTVEAAPPPEAPKGKDAAAASVGSNPNLLTPAALYGFPAEVRQRLRRYALLVRVLGGQPVADMGRLQEGAWELEQMNDQLGAPALPPGTAIPAGAGALSPARAAKAQDLVFWRQARDPVSGNTYWWNTVTWASQWMQPTVEGRGVYDWFPALAARDRPLPEGPVLPAAATALK